MQYPWEELNLGQSKCLGVTDVAFRKYKDPKEDQSIFQRLISMEKHAS